MTKNENETSETDPLTKISYPRWWRALPSLVMIMLVSNMDGILLNDFIEYRFSQLYQDNSTSSQIGRERCLNETRRSSSLLSTTTSKSGMPTTTSLSNLVQSSTARLNVFIYLGATIPATIASMILGSNCDRIGRKPLIALPFIGKLLRYIVLINVEYYHLANWCIILSVMFDGMCGAASLCILSVFAYVSDCTTVKTRTPATIITTISIASSRILPLITLGFYLQSHHYLIIMLIGFGLSLVGLIFTIFFQPESNVKARRLNIFQQLTEIKLAPVKNVFTVYLVKRQGIKQRQLLISVAIHLGFITMLCGYFAIIFLYLYGPPFCSSSLEVGIVTAVQIGAAVLMTIPFSLTIAKRTDSIFLPMIGCLCFMTQFIIFGIASHIWMLYLAVCIGAGFVVTIPVVRSRISKLVEPTEYAVVFILAGIFESAGLYAINSLVNEIYRLSLSFDPGFIFFLLASVGILPLSLMMYVDYINFSLSHFKLTILTLYFSYLFIIERRLDRLPKPVPISIND